MSPDDHDSHDQGLLDRDRSPHDPNECEAAVAVFSRVGDKWTARVVNTLAVRPRRFAELRRSIDGISQRMLTLTLRTLERDGLVARTVFATVPPAVEYRLTDLGRSLLAPVDALGAWAVAHRAELEAARRRYDGQVEEQDGGVDPDAEGLSSGSDGAAPAGDAAARTA